MIKIVLIRQKVYQLRVIWKIPLILEVDLVRVNQVKENQDANCTPGLKRKCVTIVKSMGIINLSV